MGWLRYNNKGAIRSQPLSTKLVDALSYLPEMGIEMHVFSGGQAPKGSGGPRTGSTRHDHGHAADADFYYQGRKLDWNNPEDVPIFQDIVRRGKARGLTGWGAGDDYMRAGRVHVGFGNPGVWGAGGKGANAPNWLSEAFHGHPNHIHQPNQDIADAAMTAIGKAPRTQSKRAPTVSTSGGSILSSFDTMEAPTMEPEKAGGILGSLFPNMTADRADKIAMGLMGATVNPNMAGIAARQSSLEARREDRKEAQAKALSQQQANKTAQWLGREYGEDAAGAFLSGVPLSQVVAHYRNESAKPIQINGQLVDPNTYQVVGDYRTPKGDEASEAEREIARLESIGIPRDVAIRIKEGVYKTSVDPVTREVTVIDLSSGQPVFRADTSAPEVAPIVDPNPAQVGPEASDAFGIEGILKGGINSAADFLGADMPFDGVKKTQADFAVLRENLVNDITQGYGQRVPSWLMQNIQDLTPKTGTFSGPGDAQSKLGALERSFTQELGTVRQQLGGPISPQQRQVLTNREAALNAALGKVTGALARFGSSDGGNKTSSGVTWRIEQ
ncbi:hypothetical protein [Sulfitobacter sp. R18_1]|uniref:hypothetical protein n=1 Tax=Sulfitobacter sp. R18_1 TaxID=2821104 RepID=UPI001ADBB383|nr:hypothetical protein [Sulfitobacter sp. R18_1]MBO9432361.1 hypothetical protein [Sulfitobacter sp. R18_1]